jgi:hypothetical protein
MDRKGSGRNKPAIESRFGDRGFAIEKAMLADPGAALMLDISLPIPAKNQRTACPPA